MKRLTALAFTLLLLPRSADALQQSPAAKEAATTKVAPAADPVPAALRDLEQGAYLKAIEGLRRVAATESAGGMASQMLQHVEPFITGTSQSGAISIRPASIEPALDP
ncbi:MAG TPA: hypothetical protein VK391_07920 [Allosphingosinicella sp.]|nr:hypothetical protein [Allosphingosinicella sp.]